MTSKSSKPPYTIGSTTFDPDKFFNSWEEIIKGGFLTPDGAGFRSCVLNAFGLSLNDTYVYHAIASVTLIQVQRAIAAGANAGLHAWYFDADNQPIPAPSTADISAYTTIFSSKTSTSKALQTFLSNAKKQSLRADIATYLQDKRLLPAEFIVPKLKTAQVNPSYDFWAWSCLNLEWAGPIPQSAKLRTSHHILPIFMHHFGCVVPSFEAISIIKQLSSAKSQDIIDMGSGNGYWSYILRRARLSVTAVDNGESVYRTMWIGDTILTDGIKYIKETSKGAKDKILLLVYPIVGSGFTDKIMKAYEGDTIIVVGTQNRNGYTGFKDVLIDEYVDTTMVEFKKTVQIALPSFAGKDEAMFVFQRSK